MAGGCAECERLIKRYRDAVDTWADLNADLGEAALSYEADMFLRIIDKCHLVLELCKAARRAVHRHMDLAHGEGGL